MIRQHERNKKKKSSLAQSFNRYKNQVTGNVLKSIKMAGTDVLDSLVSPLVLVEVLKEAGVQALAWKPETLCSYLDRKYTGWSDSKIAEALDHFHTTGEIQTSVPALVRHKLYAIRIIMTSDTAHHEWHIFEKVGGAFNDRLADFSTTEPMSPIECACTVALIDKIRPDKFSNEIAAYVAASCHLDGIYTLEPCKWLNFAEGHLRSMNESSAKRAFSDSIAKEIAGKLESVQKSDYVLKEDFTDIQALKLLALNEAGNSVVA